MPARNHDRAVHGWRKDEPSNRMFRGNSTFWPPPTRPPKRRGIAGADLLHGSAGSFCSRREGAAGARPSFQWPPSCSLAPLLTLPKSASPEKGQGEALDEPMARWVHGGRPAP
eukprot:scaffold1911_cov397-Prasinococcus_capsulatus_cf.AAC.31